MLQGSAAYLECCDSYSWMAMKASAMGFLILSNGAHGSECLPDEGSPGGVVGGRPPRLPAPPVCCGGVEPGGVLLPPGLEPGFPPPGCCAPPDPLGPADPPPGYGFPAGLEWSPTPDPVPPPGPFGGPPPPDALGWVCNGVHSLGYVAALEVAVP